MNTWQVFQFIYTSLETPLVASVSAMVTALESYAAAPMQLALVIYVALTGLMILRGHTGEAMGGLVGRMVKLCIVAWFATNGSAYTTWVQGLFLTTLPNELGTAVANTNGGGTIGANSFDTIWVKAFAAGLQVWKLLNDWDVGEEIVVIVFWAAALVSCVVGFTIWLLSYVILALFVSIGPLIIGLVLFPATRSIFERWIGSMISCVILQVFVVILVTLSLNVESQVVTQIANYTGTNPYQQMQALLAAVIFFVFSGIIAFQIPGMATALAGGLHMHTGAIARATLGVASGGISTVGSRIAQAGRSVDATVNAGVRNIYQRIRPPTGGSLSNSTPPRS